MATATKRQKNEWTVKSKDGRFVVSRSSDIGLEVIDLKPVEPPIGLEDMAEGTLFIESKDIDKFLDTMKMAIEQNSRQS